jgi:3-deoxy-D-manno-octulosonic-acid transferase
MHKQPEILKFFQKGKGGIQVDKTGLASLIERLLTQEEERRKFGEAAALTARENTGSARRTVEIIQNFMD